MADKHYDITYLNNSRRLLQRIKELSYEHFLQTKSGQIVDLGCGAGLDVIELAKVLGPAVKVTGIDHDPVMVEQGKRQSDGLANVNFILSEAFPLPFPDNSISGLRTERVVQHLKNPQEVINDIHRVLVPGSKVVIIETDWHSLSFYTEDVDVQRKVNSFLTDVKVNNGFAARKLNSYLDKSGFRDVAFEIHPLVVNSLEEANEYFWIEKMIAEAQIHGFLNEEEKLKFVENLQTSNKKKHFSCSINLVISSGIK